ncbi:flavin-containing monooxygenase [Halioxenophilus sp. WMMB6]|uniref:flavin-containing monooxygenase n=1 Tax=Halioxenophilus sp. WMMB6 TaxID=3073815 RepID=UPI00295EA930|nr:SidA/IucD/PvdA family monooxygenase [Halioxenophilus sp. WMMB6]
MEKKVIVVGAGLSGLAVLKELLEAGLDVTCYEMNSDIGGVFSDMASYDSVMLTVSNHFMAYSDYMPYEEPTRFWTRKEYKDYLDRYAEHFDLRKHIRFGYKLLQVEDPEGSCTLHFVSNDGETITEQCDNAVICSGQFQEPNIPMLPGLDTFDGEILHSSTYTNVEQCQHLKDKNILFFGLGESAADVVTEISAIAKHSVLSIRRPHVFSDRLPGGVPIDVIQSRFWHSLPAPIKSRAVRNTWQRVANNNPEGSARHHMGTHMVGSLDEPGSVVTKTERIFEAVSRGMELDVGGLKSINGKTVTFNSGREEEFDAIVLCTGFKLSFPFMETQYQFKDMRDLFLQVYHPQLKEKVAFIGFARPQQGGVPLMAEMAARYHALILTGQKTLPQNLPELAQADKMMWQKEFYETPHVSGLVNGLRYNEKLARLIGCEPPKPSFFNLKQFFIYWNHHIWPSQYRLVGPGARKEAQEQWMKSLNGAKKEPTTLKERARFVLGYLSLRIRSALTHDTHAKWRPF